MKKDYIRLVISDLHLGSLHSKEDEILELLQSIEFDELILAGDIIDFIKVPTFTKSTAKIFSHLSKLNKKITYIIGNHDLSFSGFVGEELLGVNFVNEYEFGYAGKKYKVVHGHQFDQGIVQWPTFMNVVSIIQDWAERTFTWKLARWWVERSLKKRKLRRIWDILSWSEEADVFIMGHTHIPEVVIWVDKNEKIKTYVNCGDWESNMTYVIIKDNQLRLKKFKPSQPKPLGQEEQQSESPSESNLKSQQGILDKPSHR
jgi:UDP-2,3-diacylglucosamine pyrophosphatase LpxH